MRVLLKSVMKYFIKNQYLIKNVLLGKYTIVFAINCAKTWEYNRHETVINEFKIIISTSVKIKTAGLGYCVTIFFFFQTILDLASQTVENRC